jgi:hypothetical protein
MTRNVLEYLQALRHQIDDLLVERDKAIVTAMHPGASAQPIADAAGLSRAHVNRILNRDAPLLRLADPDADGFWRDSTGRREKYKPRWLVAVEGSGSVRGWYFEESDARAAVEEGRYIREVIHDIDGFDWQ